MNQTTKAEPLIAEEEAEFRAEWSRWEESDYFHVQEIADLIPRLFATIDQERQKAVNAETNLSVILFFSPLPLGMGERMVQEITNLRAVLESVLQSDMAMREEDEGNLSEILNAVRVALGKAEKQ